MDAGLRIWQFDVHMHTTQHVSPTDHLQSFNELVVPMLRTLNRLRPVGCWVSTDCQDNQTVLGCSLRGDAAQLKQLGVRISATGVGTCGYFQLSLKHLTVEGRTRG